MIIRKCSASFSIEFTSLEKQMHFCSTQEYANIKDKPFNSTKTFEINMSSITLRGDRESFDRNLLVNGC